MSSDLEEKNQNKFTKKDLTLAELCAKLVVFPLWKKYKEISRLYLIDFYGYSEDIRFGTAPEFLNHPLRSQDPVNFLSQPARSGRNSFLYPPDLSLNLSTFSQVQAQDSAPAHTLIRTCASLWHLNPRGVAPQLSILWHLNLRRFGTWFGTWFGTSSGIYLGTSFGI